MDWTAAHSNFCRNGEVTDQPISMFRQDRGNNAQAIGWAFVVKPEQQHTMMGLAGTKDEFTEILVVGNEYSLFTNSPA